MINIYKPEEIKVLREGGKILASVLYQVAEMVKPGVATIELDETAERLIREAGGEPSFKNYKTAQDRIPYPASLCVSINEEVVHGIPGSREIKDNDIISLDLGMKYKNFYTDMAITIGDKKIVEITKKCLDEAIKIVKEGAFIGDIGFITQSCAEKNGFNVVRDLVGHGVGRKAHEEPEIPNFGKKGTGEILKAGMVLAIEPMLTAGSSEIVLLPDNWTWKTKDSSLAAHFEHTVVVAKNGAEILTCLPAVGRYLIGIDYGEKRIGIALSDEQGFMAFPHSVVINDKNAIREIKKICEENRIGKIILGQSLDYSNRPNPVMKKIELFKDSLEKEINIPIIYQNETLTTQEAKRIQGDIEKIDASAAALILRSFIEKKK
ncbi:MAG: type I methionyl aminopeptidase [Candidatus Parcubacteria bacterium]|nr:type I methionyl aminopeptidase [Candidatus Parcubacteria bacterium]